MRLSAAQGRDDTVLWWDERRRRFYGAWLCAALTVRNRELFGFYGGEEVDGGAEDNLVALVEGLGGGADDAVVFA
jgi:hypothetical protein